VALEGLLGKPAEGGGAGEEERPMGEEPIPPLPVVLLFEVPFMMASWE
jgi:hypothetical protein